MNRQTDDSPLLLFGDEPIRDLEADQLGLASWAQIIARAVRGAPGPFTIGILGRWGTGKTSLLRLTRELVDQSVEARDGKLISVAFNAWQYEKEESVLVPLLASILQATERGSSGKRLAELRDALRSIVFGISATVGGKVPELAEASISVDADKMTERYEKLRSRWIDEQIERSRYLNIFETLRTSRESDPDIRSIVVFIDDLDRCMPHKAVDLLESIKLILNHPGFIFVLALDTRVLETYLQKRFREDFGLEGYAHGQSYLDKMIQLPLWIPPHEKRIDALVSSLLDRPPLHSFRSEFVPLVPTIGLACDHNPRQLIRFFNDLIVDRHLYRSVKPLEEFPLEAFVVARGIRHQSEIVYQGLLTDQRLCGRVLEYEGQTGEPQLIPWLENDGDDEVRREVVRRLRGRESLVRLLSSKCAREWLRDVALRERVDRFLVEEREFKQWIQEQEKRAVSDLGSTDETRVLGACYTVFAIRHHLTDRDAILSKLEELRESGPRRVAELAGLTIERLDA